MCVSAIKKPIIFQGKHKLFNFIFIYGYVPMSVCEYFLVIVDDCGSRKRALDAVGLEFPVVVSHSTM